MLEPPTAVEFADCRMTAGPLNQPEPYSPDLLEVLTPEQVADVIDVLRGPTIPEGQDWRDLHAEDILRYTPMAADWQNPAHELPLYERLMRLAKVKALLPVDNLEKRKTRHNKSIEGYMQLALEAAGDRDTLKAHMSLIERALKDDDANNKLLAEQTLWIWGPLAEVMDWRQEKRVLEDLAFAQYLPEQYRAVCTAYDRYGGDEAMQAYMGSTREGLTAIFEDELAKSNEKGCIRVEMRQKSYYSVWRKCEKDKRPSYDLPDFIGARVIIDDSQLGEERARQLCFEIKDWAQEVFGEGTRVKDYIFNPKTNGYQSLHISLDDFEGQRLELQVRTASMHAKAETDPGASHIAYEATYKMTPGKYFKKLRKPHRIYLWREDAARQLRERATTGNHSTTALRPETMLVFRDNGNLHTLTRGYNVLDMAFDVHWQHALTTTGATVNGEVAPFNKPLSPYDLVSLKRTANGRLTWSLDWIHTVNSRSARKHLLRAMRDMNEPELVVRAEAALNAHFERQGIANGLKLLSPAMRRTMLDDARFETWGVLMRSHALGIPGFGVAFFDKHLHKAHPELFASPTEQSQEFQEPNPTKAVNSGELQLRIRGEPWVDKYHVGLCCDPGTASDLVVYASQNRGMFVVHRSGCHNIQGKSVLPASWYNA